MDKDVKSEEGKVSQSKGTLKEGGYSSPLKLLLIIATSMFVVEIAIMVVLNRFIHLSPLAEMLTDSLVLTITLFPILLYFLFRPMEIHIKERRVAEDALRRSHNELEERVNERTRELTSEIEERANVEKALKENEAYLRSIQDNAPDGIIIIDEKGIIMSFNAASEKMFGYPAGEVLGKSVNILMPEPHRNHHDEYIERYLETGEKHVIDSSRELDALIKDGTVFPIRLAISESISGERSVFTGILHDLTEQRKAEEELRKLSRAVEQSPSSVMITDTKGNLTYVNPKFCEVSGYSREEVIGHNPRFLKSGETPLSTYEGLWGALISGNEYKCELLNKKKNGDFYWESASFSPIKSPSGNITHFLAVKEDITEKKRLEGRLTELSFTDELTGIANRRSYEKAIESEWNRARRKQMPLACIMVDIDYFKSFNDNFGHIAGDDCLRKVAQAIKSVIVRAGDLVARYGGEEFILILPDSDKESARKLAEVLRKKVESLKIENPSSDISDYITISLGVASLVPGETGMGSVLVSATDSELYLAKKEGRNRVKVSEL